MVFSHFALLGAASQNFPGFLCKRLKVLMKVKCWASLVRFHGILPLEVISSSSPLRVTWPRNLNCLCSIQQSSLRSLQSSLRYI